MSYVTIHRVKENGDVVAYAWPKNNHGFAPLVWQFLTVQYKIHPTGGPYDMTPWWDYQKLFDLLGKDKMDRGDELLLGATGDRVWVRREIIPALIAAMRVFHYRYILQKGLAPTIEEAADALEKLMAEGAQDLGVAFTMSSASPNLWCVPDREEGDEAVFNILTNKLCSDGKEHWELGAALKI